MVFWIWGMVLAAMIYSGHGQTTEDPNSTSSINSTDSSTGDEVNSVWIVLSADYFLNGSGEAEWLNVTQFLDDKNVSSRFVTLTNDPTPQSVSVKAFQASNNLNVSLEDVIATEINPSEKTDKTNDSKYILLDRCSGITKDSLQEKDATFIELFNMPEINSSFQGYLIDYNSDFDTSASNYSNLSVTKAVKALMNLSHSYLITFSEHLNFSLRVNMSNRFCNGFVLQAKKLKLVTTPSEPITSAISTVASTIDDTVNTTLATTEVTTENDTTTIPFTSTEIPFTETPNITIPNPTTIEITTQQFSTATNVSVTEKTPISLGHSGASVALGIFLTLIIVLIILCVVFRKKIMTFVRSKVTRTRPIISTLGIAPYGTLRNEYDLEDFGSRRQ